MNKFMGIVLVAGLAMVAGCEEKKAPAKGAADAVKDAGKSVGDATKGAADAVKEKVADGAAALRDKAVEAMKPQVDAAKAQLDELTKKAEGLTDAVKKTAATPLVEGQVRRFQDLLHLGERQDRGRSVAQGVHRRGGQARRSREVSVTHLSSIDKDPGDGVLVIGLSLLRHTATPRNAGIWGIHPMNPEVRRSG
jgi:Sec-independent protein translocase protein TatA